MEAIIAIFFMTLLTGGLTYMAWPRHRSTPMPELITTSTTMQQELDKPKVERKSNAFVTGYRDMAKVAGIPNTEEHEVDYDYQVARHARMYNSGKFEPSRQYTIYTIVTHTETNDPICPDKWLRKIAISMLDNGFKIDLASGQTSRKYMGSDDEQEFQDYYKGGMAFIADVDEMKQHVMGERDKEKRVDRLIEVRKRGLSELNFRVEASTQALDELRTKTFSEETFEENWNRQMKEIENAEPTS